MDGSIHNSNCEGLTSMYVVLPTLSYFRSREGEVRMKIGVIYILGHEEI